MVPRREYSPCFECCLCFVSTAQAASPAGHVACMGVERACASPAAEHNGVPSHSHKQNCPSPARKTPAAPLAAMEAACTSGSCSDGSPAAWMHLLACQQLARQEELGTTHSSSMMVVSQVPAWRLACCMQQSCIDTPSCCIASCLLLVLYGMAHTPWSVRPGASCCPGTVAVPCCMSALPSCSALPPCNLAGALSGLPDHDAHPEFWHSSCSGEPKAGRSMLQCL